jgi:hypothetical protein
MRRIHGLVVLAKELGTFLLGQVPEDDPGSFGSSTWARSADMPAKLHPARAMAVSLGPAGECLSPGPAARRLSYGRLATQTVLVVRTVRSSRRRMLAGPSPSRRVPSVARSSALIWPSSAERRRRREACA